MESGSPNTFGCCSVAVRSRAVPTARINGFDMHYEIAGDGPTVVWLHGLGGSIALERKMGEGIEGLAQRGVRLIKDEADYTWEAHARDMRGLLDHLGIERAVVGGGSMGAGVSLTFALAWPERVEKLLLVSLPPL